MKHPQTNDFHALDIKRAMAVLKSSFSGISSAEAVKRLKQYGTNELPKKEGPFAINIFINQFKSSLVYILIGAAVISLFLSHFIDACVIGTALALNAVIGFIQEYKAGVDLKKLKEYIVLHSLVRREGGVIKIESRDLVPGDIIMLNTGDIVPADCRIIDARDMTINEAVLTGESVASAKDPLPLEVGLPIGDRSCMAYAGTIIERGHGEGLVSATGKDTEFGKIAGMIEETQDRKTPLQKRLAKFSNLLGLAVLLICFNLVLAGVFIAHYDFFQIFTASVAIAVAAIPEGLPIAVTVVLVVGMKSILKEKALVNKLVAAETLGTVTVICTDKTGTLTKGEMTLIHISLPEGGRHAIPQGMGGENADQLFFILKAGLLCNNSLVRQARGLKDFEVIGLPTEKALCLAAIQAGIDYEKESKTYRRVAESPFDSEKKYMLTLHSVPEGDKETGAPYVLFAKGAPELLIAKASRYLEKGEVKDFTVQTKKKISADIRKFTKEGYRVIALAYKPVDSETIPEKIDPEFENLVYLGLGIISDPLREEARSVIMECRESGIRPIILTGDHKATATSIGIESGVLERGEEAMDGAELDKIDDDMLAETVKSVSVYARISPRHKLRIVGALQKNNEVVAMVGDGVNDAPAIKAADMGIAVGSGTEVTKSASDMVLLDNNFKTIISAIFQGRVIFSNIRKVVTFLVSDSFSEIILISGALVFGLPLPLIPAQILWLNIVNDGFPNFALAFEKGDRSILKDKPLSKDEPLFTKEMKYIIFGLNIVRDLLIFLVFYLLISINEPLIETRTFIFALLGAKSLLSIFSLRNLKKPIWKMNPFSNVYLVVSIIMSFSLILMVIYIPFFSTFMGTAPLTFFHWSIIMTISLASQFSLELLKYVFNRGYR